MLRLLTFTTLYPNAAQPTFAVFVENRLRHLVATGEAEARVLAPVPWFPFRGAAFGTYGEYARAPRSETRHGLRVDHPRYLTIPKVGMNLAPALLYRAARAAVARIRREGWDFDLIDAHYLYPDGVAAARLARELGKPLVMTARGNDVTLLPTFPAQRRMILEAVAQADGIVTVSEGLRRGLIALGADGGRIVTLRNGVDLAMFRPVDRAAPRAALGFARPTVVSVGHLIERKGHDLTIRAMAALPGVDLFIVGTGPEKGALERLAASLGVADRVRLAGRVAHDKLKDVYSAADVTVLASSREGWANVLLEAMACGAPVVATNIPGTDEVVASPAAGRLVARTPEAIAEGVRAVLAAPPERTATRAYAEGFGWEPTTQGQLDLFRRILAARGRRA